MGPDADAKQKDEASGARAGWRLENETITTEPSVHGGKQYEIRLWSKEIPNRICDRALE